MKYLLITLFVCATFCAGAQTTSYNKVLADSLGADEYGMKMYVLAILKTGPSKTDNKAVTDSLFKGHIDNIGRLVKEGRLIVAGPLKKNEKAYRGIFILNVATIEQARELVNTDPAIKEGMFEVEFYQWYGSAALPTYLPNHEKVERQKH